jgi:hypothetical protein
MPSEGRGILSPVKAKAAAGKSLPLNGILVEKGEGGGGHHHVV